MYFDIFLQNAYIPIYGITLLVSIYRYPKYYESKLKFLPILFIYTFLNELLGKLITNYEEFSLITSDTYSDYNWLIFNIYTVIFYLYFYYIFWHYIESKQSRNIIFYGAILFLAVSLINAFIQNFSMIPQTYAYVVGGLILIYCISVYCKKFVALPDIFRNKENILFWLSTGLLIFYLGYLPIKIIRYINTMEGLTPHPMVKRIHLLLIIISYTCFIIGFLRMKKRLAR